MSLTWRLIYSLVHHLLSTTNVSTHAGWIEITADEAAASWIYRTKQRSIWCTDPFREEKGWFWLHWWLTTSDYIDDFVIVFINDNLIYSNDEVEHTQHVRWVLNKLREAQLHANMTKCSFYQHSIEFLGHIVSGYGTAMDPKKVQAVVEWPSLTNKHDDARF